MDRQSKLAALATLGSLQKLQTAEARLLLAGHLAALDLAVAEREAAYAAERDAERAYGVLMAGDIFDPDALARHADDLVATEARLIEATKIETRSREREKKTRLEWHRHRLRGDAVDRLARDLRRKLEQIGEDRMAMAHLSLGAIRRGSE